MFLICFKWRICQIFHQFGLIYLLVLIAVVASEKIVIKWRVKWRPMWTFVAQVPWGIITRDFTMLDNIEAEFFLFDSAWIPEICDWNAAKMRSSANRPIRNWRRVRTLVTLHCCRWSQGEVFACYADARVTCNVWLAWSSLQMGIHEAPWKSWFSEIAPCSCIAKCWMRNGIWFSCQLCSSERPFLWKTVQR